MKKILFAVALALSMSCANGASRENASKVELDERIVQLTPIEWDSVKKAVDSTNFCHIASHNTTIIITNSIPDIKPIHHFPFGRIPQKVEPRRIEPQPYVGQGSFGK